MEQEQQTAAHLRTSKHMSHTVYETVCNRCNLHTIEDVFDQYNDSQSKLCWFKLTPTKLVC